MGRKGKGAKRTWNDDVGDLSEDRDAGGAEAVGDAWFSVRSVSPYQNRICTFLETWVKRSTKGDARQILVPILRLCAGCVQQEAIGACAGVVSQYMRIPPVHEDSFVDYGLLKGRVGIGVTKGPADLLGSGVSVAPQVLVVLGTRALEKGDYQRDRIYKRCPPIMLSSIISKKWRPHKLGLFF